MASKTPSRLRKDKARSARPYDRPNQGILGRVASKVKNLFTPSWLFSVPSWVRTGPEETSCPPNATEEDLTENEDDEPVEEPAPKIQPHKRARYDINVNVASTSQTQSWLGPSTSKAILSEDVDRTNRPTSGIMQNCDIGKKDTQIIVNGEGDDHSENSDGSASTSGCSSLVSSHQDRLNRSSGLRLSETALEHLRGEFKGKQAFQRPRKDASISTDTFSGQNLSGNQSRLSLWSCGTQTPSKSTPKPRPVAQGNKPSFSISSFGGPSMANVSASKKACSPFYEGNTTFGGASAYRKRQISSIPYQSEKSFRNQIKIKESQFSGDLECMSSAAKRILHTLEKMSTPVTDAKKIPNMSRSPIDISLSFTPTSQRRNSYLSFSKKTPGSSSKGPPIVNLNTVSKLTVLKNHSTKMTRNSNMGIPLKERLSALPSESSTDVTPDISSNKAGGGKMRSRISQPLHRSSKAKEDTEILEEYDLPQVPLCITNLPKINFDSKVATPTSISRARKSDSVQIEQPSFTFANPIGYSPPKAVLQLKSATTEDAFKFSSPVVVNENSSSSKPFGGSQKRKEVEKGDDPIVYESVNNILKTMRKSSNKKVLENDAEKEESKKGQRTLSRAESESVKAFNTGFGDKFKPQPGSWECSSCLVRNEGSKEKCDACETPKCSSNSKSSAEQKNKVVNKFQFQTEPGTWKCTTCLIRNQDIHTKCAACETPRPSSLPSLSSSSGFGDKFKPQSGSWECSSCMVRNKASDSKCVACESPNPNPSSGQVSEMQERAENSTSKMIFTGATGTLIQKSTGTWECDTCLVRNPLDKSKCLACETLRPSKEIPTGFKESSGFKFMGAQQNSAPIPFKFGNLVSNSSSAPTTSSFKLGNSLDVKSSTASTFKFGVLTETAVPSTTSTFKFGVSTESTPQSEPSENIPHTLSTSIIKSGVPSETTTRSLSASTVKFGAPSDAAKLSITSTLKSGLETDTTKPSESFKFGNPVASTEGFKFNPPAAVSSTDSGSFKFSPPSVQSTDTGGFKFTAPVSSADSGGFKLAVSASETAATTFKFGSTELKTVDGFGFKPSTNSTPSNVTFGNFTSTQNSTDHSKTISEKIPENQSQTATEIKKTSEIKTVATEQSKLAPGFTFGAPISTSVSESTPNSSVTSGFTFGNISTGVAQPASFKLSNKTEAVNILTSTHTTTTATTFGSICSAPSFSFGTNPVKSFSTAPSVTASNKLETNPTSLVQDNISRTQASQNPIPASSSTTSIPQPSTFIFGSTNMATPAAPSFKFGATATASTTDSLQKNTSIFSFGAASSTDAKLPQTGFAFKSASEESAQNQIAFKSFKSDPVNPAVTSSSGGFQFGTAVHTPASTGGFVFGAPKGDTSQAAATPFAFGSGSVKPANSNFSGFPQSQPATTASVPSFSFGSNLPNTSTVSSGFNPSGSIGVFSFGAKNNQAPSSSINPTPTPAAVFGSTVQPVFGSNTAAPTFGSEQKTEATGGFNFGAASPVFRFGASMEKKPAMNPPQPAGFNFNMTPQPEATSNFSQGFSINTPPSFNFGATSTPNLPFQFAASNEPSGNQSSAPRRIRKAIRRGLRKQE